MDGMATQAGMSGAGGGLVALFGDTYLFRDQPNTPQDGGSLQTKYENQSAPFNRHIYLVFDNVIAGQEYALILTFGSTQAVKKANRVTLYHLIDHIDPAVATWNMFEPTKPQNIQVGVSQYKDVQAVAGEELRYILTPTVSGRLNLYLPMTQSFSESTLIWVFESSETNAALQPRLEAI